MAEQNEVNAIALKLPQFWPQQPEVWFAQAQAQFQVRNITSEDTKYHYVIAALDQDTAGRILDFLRSPPENDKFTRLKERLLVTFTQSDFERAGLLLDMPKLGDSKPSALMDKMLALLPANHTPCFLFQRIFLNSLPEDMRGILAHSNIKEARDLALAADKLWEAQRNSAAYSVRKSAVKHNHKNADQHQGNPDFCYYHNKFGNKAYNCQQPCKHAQAKASGNETTGRQ